ncbi:uncharacterized protein [Mobula birostris]|uniref:uncharacterized protein isoform X2 n=1 Tax=Mobula birostris TaxID=1983395 RepID=UPI003B28B58A
MVVTDVFPGVGQQERRLLFHIDGGKISRWSEAKIFEVWLKAAGNELNRGKAEPDESYAELNVKTLSALRVQTDEDDLTSTYSELNFRKEEPRIDEDEDPPIASGPGGLPTTAQTGAHKQEPKENIGNRSHLSQTRQSLITSDRNYRRLWEQHQEMNRTQRQYQQQVHELNSTLKSRTSENSRLELSQRNCLKNLSVLNNNLSKLENNITVLNSELTELNQTDIELRHECNQLETKYRTITETKAQICQYLSRRREQTRSQDWFENENRCYFISTVVKSYDGARGYCSEFDAGLLEINSNEEKNVVSKALADQYPAYWIGKCEDRDVASRLLYKYFSGTSVCVNCNSHIWRNYCERQHRFICEKSAHSCTDIPEKIRDLCQQSVGPT